MLRPIRATQRLAAIFIVTILTPGLILGIFGWRALRQEKKIADQEIRERLNAAAEDIGRRLEFDFKEWQHAADRLVQGDPANRESWPELLRRAADSTGAAVVLYRNGMRIESLPQGEVLYDLSEPSPFKSAPVSPLIEQAESLEIRDKNYDAAVAIYRRLLDSNLVARATVLHGLGRNLKKAGHTDEALQTFQALEKEPSVRIDSLPSDLVALYEIAELETGSGRSRDALRLYEGLVHGRWALDKSSYVVYSEKAREWLNDANSARDLIEEEQRKLSLSWFAEQVVDGPRSFVSGGSSAYVAFWHMDPFAAILLGEPSLRSGLSSLADAPDFEVKLLFPGNGTAASHEPQAMYTVQNVALPLQVQVWPKEPRALYAAVDRREKLYIGMLAVVVALLGFGGYLTARTLKSELAVAQMKSDFVSTVSHEFRSPLAGVNQLAEMLRDGRVHDETRRQQYYEMIVTETQRLRRLVENVLDFARMEDGRKQYRFEAVEPAVWLREIAEDFRTEVAAAGFVVEAEIPAELPAIVADRETLTTAVHNLLDNAVKYSGGSNIVRMKAGTDSGGLTISVRDEGVGIREEDQERIFEKFYRGGGEIAREVKGVGLGLNLVQHIVAAHGGSISFDSKEGRGSTFTIRLKLAGNRV